MKFLQIAQKQDFHVYLFTTPTWYKLHVLYITDMISMASPTFAIIFSQSETCLRYLQK